LGESLFEVKHYCTIKKSNIFLVFSTAQFPKDFHTWNK